MEPSRVELLLVGRVSGNDKLWVSNLVAAGVLSQKAHARHFARAREGPGKRLERIFSVHRGVPRHHHRGLRRRKKRSEGTRTRQQPGAQYLRHVGLLHKVRWNRVFREVQGVVGALVAALPILHLLPADTGPPSTRMVMEKADLRQRRIRYRSSFSRVSSQTAAA